MEKSINPNTPILHHSITPMLSVANYLQVRARPLVGILAAVILGLIFLIAGLGKLPVQTDAYSILLVIQRMPLLLFLSDYVHIVFPVLEVLLGLLLILGIAAKVMAAASAVLVAAFIFNNLWLIRKGLALDPCYCFGGSLNWLLGIISVRESLYIDVAMLVLICLVVTQYPGGFNLRPWFLKRSMNQVGEV